MGAGVKASGQRDRETATTTGTTAAATAVGTNLWCWLTFATMHAVWSHLYGSRVVDNTSMILT